MVPNVSINQRFYCIPHVINICLLLVNIHVVVETSHQDIHCPQTTAVPGSVDTSLPVPPGSQQNAGVSSNTIQPGIAHLVH